MKLDIETIKSKEAIQAYAATLVAGIIVVAMITGNSTEALVGSAVAIIAGLVGYYRGKKNVI